MFSPHTACSLGYNFTAPLWIGSDQSKPTSPWSTSSTVCSPRLKQLLPFFLHASPLFFLLCLFVSHPETETQGDVMLAETTQRWCMAGLQKTHTYYIRVYGTLNWTVASEQVASLHPLVLRTSNQGIDRNFRLSAVWLTIPITWLSTHQTHLWAVVCTVYTPNQYGSFSADKSVNIHFPNCQCSFDIKSC